MVRRHECLRTVFDSVDGEARQIVLSDVHVQIPILDVTHLPRVDRQREALRIAREEGKKPFELTRGPLVRVLLVRLDWDQHLLVLSMHHIVTDGWSISILFRELARCYEAHMKGQEPRLPELPLQYVEHAQWQREYISGEVLASQVDYWKNKLAGAQTILDWSLDCPRPPVHSAHGATEELIFERAILAEMNKLARQENATLFMVTMAAFQALLWRYTGQESILVGTPTAARGHVEIENLIGFFVNTLVFRADFDGKLSFRDLLRQVRSYALDAYAHQDVPFERLVEELAPDRSMDTTPIFQAMLTFQNIPKQIFEISGLEMKELEFETGIAKFDLSVEFYEDHDFHCRFEYNTDVFKRETILRKLAHFRNLVHAILQNPDQRVAAIPLMDSAEREQVIAGWNNTAADYPTGLRIESVFERQAGQAPDATALVFHKTEITYRQLNDRANSLAHHLIGKGVAPGTFVGVFLNRSPEMVVSVLAVLKAGAAYVPLDPTYPADRLAFMIDDAGLSCVVTHSALGDMLPGSTRNVIVIDREPEGIGSGSGCNPPMKTPDAAAYVIYTSGTSGRPKGVEGTHRGAVNRFGWMWERYPFEAGEVCCQKTNLSFVDSIWEIFGPLLAGVPSVILPQEVVLDPEEMLEHLARHGVTRIVLVPSLLRALLDHAPNLGERVPGLKLWTSSGEVLPAELGQRFRRACPEAKLLNIYGSSEVAADVTCHEVREEDRVTVPIGKPIHNTQVYVLDGERNAVPVGVRGEIYIGGEGLALGYWKRAELTGERFVENEIAPERSKRLYRTGDVGRWRGDGELEYVGRVDSEVKLRGMRIELGEIEAVLVGEGGVGAAAVEVEGGGGDEKLVAYVELREGERPTASELRRRLRKKLPEHMVPAGYVVVEELPKLASGKVNRRELAKVEGERLREQGKQPARSEAERKLVEIWEELLKVEEVGVEENFFELGGHSLLGLQVVARVRRRFEVELPVRAVFEEPTIAGLARAIEKAEAEGLKTPMPVLKSRAQSSPPAINRAALLAELDKLSADDVQNLLKRVLSGKETEPIIRGPQL